MIVMQIFFLQRWAHFRLEWSRGLLEPLIDQSEEFANICSPIPGSFTGYLFFFVFGTTAESQTEIQKIQSAVKRWCCGCFRRSKSSENEKPYNRPASKRKFGSRSISYPKPKSDSLLLSPARTISPKQPSGFSSRRDGFYYAPILRSPPTSAPPPRTRNIEDDFQFASHARYGPRIYSPVSSNSRPVPLGYLRSQHEQAESPRFSARGYISSPPAIKQLFCPSRRRCFVPTPSVMMMYEREKSLNSDYFYMDMRRESG